MASETLVRARRLLATLSVSVLAACGVGPEESAQGQEPPGASEVGAALSTQNTIAQGFAWINRFSPSVSPSYSYNSSGGAITYTHTPTGNYRVVFSGLGRWSGNVQVVAYGDTPERCRINNWAPEGTDLAIYVRCHRPDGTPAESSFVVYYIDRTGSSPNFPQGAYLWTSAPNGTVGAGYTWNDAGGVNSVVRNGTGYYTATLPGIAFSNASVHVTACGGNGAQHCKVLGWGASTSGASVNVLCYDALGNPADSLFTLSYWRQSMFPYHMGGHAWVDATPSVPSSYQQLAPEFSCFAPGSASLPIAGDGTLVSMTKTYRAFDSMTMVTAYGLGPNYCKVVGWYGGPDTANSETRMQVRCFDRSGAVTPSPYTLTYTLKWMVGPC